MKLIGIPRMGFEDMLACATRNRREAVITVGTLINGRANYTVYGENAAVLPQRAYSYEVGSLTKTFTASLLCKAIAEGKMALENPIGCYLPLPAGAHNPTLRQIVTHSSGYKRSYREKQSPEEPRKLSQTALLCGLSKETLLARAAAIRVPAREQYPYRYSNFAVSLLGAALSEVYGVPFAALMNQFAVRELGLSRTRISDGSGELGRLWPWTETGAYLPAGGLLSTAEDLLAYARLQIGGSPAYLQAAHAPHAKPGALYAAAAKFHLRHDAIGTIWLRDEANQIIWHLGATGSYNCYLGFDPVKQLAVVVLSNLPFQTGVPAGVMGAKLLIELQGQG